MTVFGSDTVFVLVCLRQNTGLTKEKRARLDHYFGMWVALSITYMLHTLCCLVLGAAGGQRRTKMDDGRGGGGDIFSALICL